MERLAGTLASLLARPQVVWLLLALPALPVVALLAGDNPRAVHIAVHPTGEWAARFTILALMATPLVMLLKDWRGPRWLRRNRRYLGVAAFAYALAHTLLYLVDKGTPAKVLSELPRFYVWTGWLAFLVFLPLAATSFDGAVRALGTAWKPLQRGVYAAAILTLLHWASLHKWGEILPAAIHFAPLAALTAWRLWRTYGRPRPPLAA